LEFGKQTRRGGLRRSGRARSRRLSRTRGEVASLGLEVRGRMRQLVDVSFERAPVSTSVENAGGVQGRSEKASRGSRRFQRGDSQPGDSQPGSRSWPDGAETPVTSFRCYSPSPPVRACAGLRAFGRAVCLLDETGASVDLGDFKLRPSRRRAPPRGLARTGRANRASTELVRLPVGTPAARRPRFGGGPPPRGGAW